MGARVEHWFNRRYGISRRDIYLLRTDTGWQVLGRIGGAEGREVVHYFETEADARQTLERMKQLVPQSEDNWAEMTAYKQRPRKQRRKYVSHRWKPPSCHFARRPPLTPVPVGGAAARRAPLAEAAAGTREREGRQTRASQTPLLCHRPLL